jgi:hypothetical protein
MVGHIKWWDSNRCLSYRAYMDKYTSHAPSTHLGGDGDGGACDLPVSVDPQQALLVRNRHLQLRQDLYEDIIRVC